MVQKKLLRWYAWIAQVPGTKNNTARIRVSSMSTTWKHQPWPIFRHRVAKDHTRRRSWAELCHGTLSFKSCQIVRLLWQTNKQSPSQIQPNAMFETKVWLVPLQVRVGLVPSLTHERHVAWCKVTWLLHVPMDQQKTFSSTCLGSHYASIHCWAWSCNLANHIFMMATYIIEQIWFALLFIIEQIWFALLFFIQIQLDDGWGKWSWSIWFGMWQSWIVSFAQNLRKFLPIWFELPRHMQDWFGPKKNVKDYPQKSRKKPQKSRKNHQNPANPEKTDSRSFGILQMLWIYHKFRPLVATSWLLALLRERKA